MAGQKLLHGTVGLGDDIQGRQVGGYPLVIIVENGNVEAGDEWGLFRLTDEGLAWYNEGAEFAAGIMRMEIDGKSAVKEIARKKTEAEAVAFRCSLPLEERRRTLIRSVRPVNVAQ